MTTSEIAAAATGNPEWSRPGSAAEARATVRGLLSERLGTGDSGAGAAGGSARRIEESRLADALLVTSELVTNAILHGGGVTRFAARITREGLRLQVTDRSRVRPATVSRTNDSYGTLPGGHGWPLIQRLCRDITITPLRGGKTIQVLVGLI
ncbi:ATP-binding protein [Streptomyces sp. NPDC059828]|uniref:ATP-binding protein n=1 Tax=Streptomyces sp. NPDC059828 TaxID=3346965 RepID=UPI003651FE49